MRVPMLRHRTVVSWTIAGICAVAFAVSASAPQAVHAMRDGVPAVASDGGQRGAGGGAPGGQGGQGRQSGPRPYADVITSAAKTDEGIFKVHRITEGSRDSLFYEIPKAQLDKDFLWNTQLKKT